MIGIFAPYGRNEVTAAAIRLADLAISVGQDVKLIAYGVHERNVSPFWDSRVLNSKGDGVYYGARGCDSIVHFMCHPSSLSMTRLVAESARHILVPPWQTMYNEELQTLKNYDLVVCPSKACWQVLHQDVFDGEAQSNLTWCRWESGLPAINREGRIADNAMKVCVCCDNTAIDYSGPMILQLVRELLDMIPKLYITVASSKSWCRGDRSMFKKLIARFDKRLTFRGSGNFVEQARMFHQHDWIVLPCLRADFGIMANKALSCGAPVICHNVDPFAELIIDKHNGLLVPCEIQASAVKAPIAVAQLGKWLEVCHQAFRGPHALLQLQLVNWHLEDHLKAFVNFWLKTLGM